MAASTRSSSMATSSGSTASGSMCTDWNSMPPVTATLTTPPPAWPSITCSAAAAWASISCSCICWACFIRSFILGCFGDTGCSLFLDDLGALEGLHDVVDGRGYCRGGRISELFDVDRLFLDDFWRRGVGRLVDDKAQRNGAAELGRERSFDVTLDAFASLHVDLVRQGVCGGSAVDLDEPTRLVERLGLRTQLIEHAVAPCEGELVPGRQVCGARVLRRCLLRRRGRGRRGGDIGLR